MTDRRYRMWLAYAAGQRNRRQMKLLEEFDGDAKAIFDAAAQGSIAVQTSSDEELFALMKAKATERYIDRCESYLEKHGITMVLPEDDNYPALLREIYTPPMALYVKGRLPGSIPLPIAMIGSRECSLYGQETAEWLSGQLAERGVCIVSGMAHGIDKASALGALAHSPDGCFPTVAVLGCGVDIVYPSENRRLYDEICERGAVISEFQPGTKPMSGNFPQRNRIISGMSKGVVVVEAAIKSGTSITVDYALDQGRDVFAVPGRITDTFCQGTNMMIREGVAKPVFSVKDILEEYGVASNAPSPAKEIDESGLTLEQTLIVRLLRAGERTIDELCEMTGFDMGKLNSTLTELELAEIIRQSPGRVYGL